MRRKPVEEWTSDTLRLFYACVLCRRVYEGNARWQFGVPAVCTACTADDVREQGIAQCAQGRPT